MQYDPRVASPGAPRYNVRPGLGEVGILDRLWVASSGMTSVHADETHTSYLWGDF